MWTRRELKEKGKFRFKANYWKTVLVSLIVLILGAGVGNSGMNITEKINPTHHGTTEAVTGNVSQATSTIDLVAIAMMAVMAIIIFLVALAVGLAISAFLVNPIEVGSSRFFVHNLDENAEAKEVLSGFDTSYMNGVKIMFFRDLFTILWSLLFVIPGIIKSYEYRMIPYLLADNPDMSKDDAFAISKQMMDGNKWNAFVLDLSFILWHILSVFTAGILEVFYVAPYINMTNAALYTTLKTNYQQGAEV